MTGFFITAERVLEPQRPCGMTGGGERERESYKSNLGTAADPKLEKCQHYEWH